jgi:hypothetical protein
MLPSDSEVARRLPLVLRSRGPCTSQCQYKPPRLELHEMEGKWALASPFYVPPFATQATLRRRITNIYICPEHFNVHYCSNSCPTVLNSDRCLMCPVTGCIYNNAVELTRSWRTSSRTEASQTQDKTDPMSHQRESDGRVCLKLQAHNKQDCRHIKIALEALNCLLFSQTRVQHEIESYTIAKKSAMKLVARYNRECAKRGLPRNAAVMQRLFSNECSTRGRYLHRVAQMKNNKLFVESLAADTVRMYRHLHEKMTISFDQFVVAAVYLMRRNVNCGVSIAARPMLHVLLPPANAVPKFFPSCNFTASKNAISKAVRQIAKK